MSTTTWTLDAAHDAAKTLTALGVTASVRSVDDVVGGEVVKVYSVHARATNTVGSGRVHVAQSPDGFDAAAISADLKKQVATAGKATRAAIRREKDVT
jgi:hypothetical protein